MGKNKALPSMLDIKTNAQYHLIYWCVAKAF